MRPKDSIRWIRRVFGWPLPSRIAYRDIATRFHLVGEEGPNNVITIHVSGALTIQDTPHLIQQRGDQRERQFQFLAYCIPKSISEPWIGDLRETREAMRLEGFSQRAITWATVSQFALLLIHWSIDKILVRVQGVRVLRSRKHLDAGR